MLDRTTLDLIDAAQRTEPTPFLACQLLATLDLTILDPKATVQAIDALCRDAVTPHGPVAAVCILPGFVRHVRAALAGTGVKVATVVDFPDGRGSPEDVMREIEAALHEGAEEIDMVFPYGRFLADEAPPASKNIHAARDASGYDIRLKVILEVGAYPNTRSLASAARIAIQAGADFLKTSTGRHGTGATLEAAATMLSEIAASGLPVGFKASGSITGLKSAAAYLALAESIMGEGWATPDRFRIGASSLLSALLACL